jgi:hypothetical protein
MIFIGWNIPSDPLAWAEAETPKKKLRSVAEREANWRDTQACIMNTGLACPKCGGELIRTGGILTSYPPQERLRCDKCSHEVCVRC